MISKYSSKTAVKLLITVSLVFFNACGGGGGAIPVVHKVVLAMAQVIDGRRPQS